MKTVEKIITHLMKPMNPILSFNQFMNQKSKKPSKNLPMFKVKDQMRIPVKEFAYRCCVFYVIKFDSIYFKFTVNILNTQSTESTAPHNASNSQSGIVIHPKSKVPQSKDFIKSQIKGNVYSLREVKKRQLKNQSTVWKNMRQVLDENQNDLPGIYSCSICLNVIINEGKSTTPFLRHLCTTDKNQMSITTFAKTSSLEKGKKVKVSAQDHQMLRDGIVQFMCSDIRPFSAVEGRGFVAAMCSAIKIGQAYPNLEYSEFQKVLPSRSTVQREIETKVDVAKEKVKAKLHEAYKSFGGFACTSDLWTDDYRQKTYISLTAHVSELCDNEIKYERYILGVEEVRQQVKSKEVVESRILDMLLTYGFTEIDVRSSIHFVTDRGSQYKAIDKFQRANCFAHMLHNIVSAMCKDVELNEIISNAKSLVRYVKKAGINYRSNLRLKSYCETRWSTVFTMLSSIVSKFEDIYKVLEERQNQNKKYSDCLKYIECLHKSTLSAIVSFLEPFKVWTDYIEADKCITIHRVWPIHAKVMQHMKISTDTDPKSKKFQLIEGIKTIGREYIRSIQNDFSPTMEQNIAIALHIRMKKLKKMTEAMRELTYQRIDLLISNNSSLPTVIAPKERKSTSNNLFDSFADSDCDDTTNYKEKKYCPELEEYLRMPISDVQFYDKDDTTTLRQWWFKHKDVFPNLFKLFMKISSIPASSAPSERCFSVTGQIISERRSCISPENVGNIMMCRNLY